MAKFHHQQLGRIVVRCLQARKCIREKSGALLQSHGNQVNAQGTAQLAVKIDRSGALTQLLGPQVRDGGDGQGRHHRRQPYAADHDPDRANNVSIDGPFTV